MILRVRNVLGINIQKRIFARLKALLKQPIFWLATIAGNSMVAGAAILFHYLEADINPNIHSFLDCLHWSVGIVTTIGYGEITPITTAGKILAIFLMAGGAIFLWTYMALFVTALVSTETDILTSEIRELEEKVKAMAKRLDEGR